MDGSSRDYKKNIEPMTDEDLANLFKVLDEVDMVRFLYKQEPDEATLRVGMIAEEMPDQLASKDRKHLALGRHVGFLMGIVKALNAQRRQMALEIAELKEEIHSLQSMME